MKKSIINLIVVFAITLSVSLAFAWGDKKEKIKFMSKTLSTYGEILDGLDNDKDVEVYGILTIPNKTEGKIPAIIFMHGSSGGFTKNAIKRINPWLRMFNKIGIATFKVDSFKGRGVSSTVGNQRAVSSSEMVVDVYKALDLLAKHPRIDATRIGIMGGSKGGGVALNSYWKPIRDAIGTEFQFALHIPLYGLAMDFETFEFTDAPILVLIGGKDDWTPAAPWRPLVKKLQDNGYDAELVVYEGAYHSFDAPYSVRRYSKSHSYKDCRFLVKEDGEVIETTSGLSAETGEGLKACRNEKSGVMIGENMKAKKQSKLKTQQFVTRVFKLDENPVASKKKTKTASVSSGYNSNEK